MAKAPDKLVIKSPNNTRIHYRGVNGGQLGRKRGRYKVGAAKR